MDPNAYLLAFTATATAGGLAVGLVPEVLNRHLDMMRAEEQKRAADNVIGPTEEEAEWLYWTNPEAQA